MKWFLSISAIAALTAGITLGFMGDKSVLWACFMASGALLFVANLDRIEAIKASPSGFEAKTRDLITRAEHTLSELQLLAKLVSEMTLSLVKRQGRWGGYEDTEQERVKEIVLNVLTKIGVDTSSFPELLKEWHMITEFDYAHAILGGSHTPTTDSSETMAKWKSLRNGFEKIPSATEIGKFLNESNLTNEGVEEYLVDYEHYQRTRTHRRPDVWKNRENWGSLKEIHSTS